MNMLTYIKNKYMNLASLPAQRSSTTGNTMSALNRENITTSSFGQSYWLHRKMWSNFSHLSGKIVVLKHLTLRRINGLAVHWNTSSLLWPCDYTAVTVQQIMIGPFSKIFHSNTKLLCILLLDMLMHRSKGFGHRLGTFPFIVIVLNLSRKFS